MHVTDDNGKLRSNEDFINYIENLGDAYEAIEEMYYMIQFLARGIKTKSRKQESRFMKKVN